MSAASRWSLMIDPQLQGIKWIANRETPNGLKIIQQSQSKYIDMVGLIILVLPGPHLKQSSHCLT